MTATPSTSSARSSGLMQRLLAMWRTQSLFGKAGLFLGGVFLILQGIEWMCLKFGLISANPGNSVLLKLWAFLKDIGVVGGLSAVCWDTLKSKLQEKSSDKQAEPNEPKHPGIRFKGSDPGEFVGLNFQQWFVTLNILFITVLFGGVVTSFLVGWRSFFITVPALVIIGGLLTGLNIMASQRTDFQHWWGAIVGLSPLLLFILLIVPRIIHENHEFGGMVRTFDGQGLAWILFIYAIVIFIPTYRLFELIAPGTPPFKNTTGSLISLSYVVLVAGLGVFIPLALKSTDGTATPDSRFIGEWTKPDESWRGGGRANQSLTVTATTLVWSYVEIHSYSQADTVKSNVDKSSRYRWVNANEIELLDLKSGGGDKITIRVRLDFITDQQLMLVREENGRMFSSDPFVHLVGKFQKK